MVGDKSDFSESIEIRFDKQGFVFYVGEIKDKEKTANGFLELCLISINNPEIIYHAVELCKENGITEKNWVKEAITKIKKHPRRY